MKKISILFILIFFCSNLYSQMQTNFLEPVASPQASASQNVGMTKIEIYY